MKKYSISVITWDFNFRERLHSINSLNSLLSKSDLEFELIISGNCKKSIQSIETSAKEKVHFLPSVYKHYHPGKLLHDGFIHSKNKYILFCDGDIIFPKELIFFIKDSILHNHIGLFTRYHQARPSDGIPMQGPKLYDSLLRAETVKNYFMPQKINNFATGILISRECYLSSGGFDNSDLFATMNTLFCWDLVKRAEKSSRESAKVCPYPTFHPWHDTPKEKIERLDKLLINIIIYLQKLSFLVGKPNSIGRKMINKFFNSIIKINLSKWGHG